jgi:putative SOS response-associated peptidase YedK
MCGRYSLTQQEWDIDLGSVKVSIRTRKRYNIGPMQKAPVIRFREDQAVVEELRWGLIPSWAKDTKLAASCINARSETVAEKPAFRSAFKSRRCLVPADGFYEWVAQGKLKLPWRMVLKSGEPMLFAGLWECWQPKEQPAVREETFTVLTTTPNQEAGRIHDRMPVILKREDALVWLRPETTKEQLLSLCVPAPDGCLDTFRVSPVVNSARNDVPECVDRIALQAELGS